MSNDKWKHDNTVLLALRVTKSSGIPEALKKMNIETGLSTSEYIRKKITESLIHEGFLIPAEK